MNFKEFVELTRPVIGGKSGVHKYVRSLFDAILTDSGRDILDDYSESSYKAYANGNTQITKIAKAMSPYLDPVEFASFIYEAEESAQLELCERFTLHLPGINPQNVGEEIADLLASIIREAAGSKRKSTLKNAQENTVTTSHDIISEKIFASGKTVADAFGKAILAIADDMSESKTAEDDMGDAPEKSSKDDKLTVLKVNELSDEDKESLKSFRTNSKELLRYIIDNDPAAGPTVIYLSDWIAEVVQKWRLRYREIEDLTLRTLVADILKTLGEYTYYISDVFLRYIPERNVLWFKNESWEEGNRLRNILQPKSYELRCKVAKLYETLYPIPEDEQVDTKTTKVGGVDDKESSSDTQERSKSDTNVQIVEKATVVNQYGENCVHIDHVDTFKL